MEMKMNVAVFKDPKDYARKLKGFFPLGANNAAMVKEAKAAYPLAPGSFWRDVALELDRFDKGFDAPYGT